ncbi:Single-stranded-DNA-specific exonuclease RecJ [uncultured delta proteobacterium]|uniref:Single-stranded-DNA-specific exonuclease RecJ n=1 Tax=uncultured delta proteobacterium TaxID=34034 RepID=A0A212JVR3_9DELT|nr:Single-stranded-DNA-specific exonuclease RecJ [uncultured delta proteobacterium]
MMPTTQTWRNRYTDSLPDAGTLRDLAGRLDISPSFAALLWQRGFQDLTAMSRFLAPNLRNLAPLEEWPDITNAARVLFDALVKGKSLLVWGDYDVDGITSTALVKDFLAFHGFAVRHHIPSRLESGYGLNAAVIESLAAEGVSCILTVDCGISDMEPVARAKELGMTVVVSDHHLPGEELPEADAICDPRLGPCPCPALAGVGVAFLLMAALNTLLADKTGKKADMRDYLDLVALGTLADVVELTGQNRILAKNGLLALAGGKRPGIAALKNVCNQSPTAALEAGQVVYMLAPRINAAGRMGKSDLAVSLMLTHDRDRAAELARELDILNQARRDEEKDIMAEAQEQAEQQAAAGRMGLVLHAPHWHPGIIGIVASRIVETLHRPAVVLCSDRGAIKGSGRSVADFDLHAALAACSELFIAFGGHRQAAGVTLAEENLEVFADRFNEIAARELGDEASPPEVSIDAELGFNDAADFTFLKELELLHPFGPGNPEPVFLSPPVTVKSVQTRNGGLNLTEFTHKETGITLRGKTWRQHASLPQAMKGKTVRLAYTPHIDRYNGVASVELKLRAWKPENQEDLP